MQCLSINLCAWRRLRQGEPRGTSAWQSSQPVETQRPPTQERTLLSRGSRVRVAAGAPFPKEFANFDPKKIIGEHRSNKVISLASSRHISAKTRLDHGTGIRYRLRCTLSRVKAYISAVGPGTTFR